MVDSYRQAISVQISFMDDSIYFMKNNFCRQLKILRGYANIGVLK